MVQRTCRPPHSVKRTIPDSHSAPIPKWISTLLIPLPRPQVIRRPRSWINIVCGCYFNHDSLALANSLRSVYMFFTEFSVHITLFHRPTWKMECTHPVLLLKVMRAYGALFTKTLTAKKFYRQQFDISRDMLLLEFVCLGDFIKTNIIIISSHSCRYRFKLHPERPHLSNACGGNYLN